MAFALRKPPDLSPKLAAFPYQIEAVKTVRDMPYAAIFHEQGLGKTKIAIDVALYWLEKDIVDTIFVVTKKSLVQNWVNEISTHSNLSPRVLSDNRRDNSHSLNAAVLLYVLNYEVCLSNQELMELFLKTCRVGTILDESHKIKNPEAKLTNAFLSLSGSFHRKVIMTGTPVANRPQDIWSQVKFLDDGKALGDDFETFKAKTDLPKHIVGSSSDTANNLQESTEEEGDVLSYGDTLEEINQKIRGFSIRETKQTSGLELPEKTILSHKVVMAPLQRQIYNNYKDDLCHQIETAGRVQEDQAESVLKRLLRLVQCASNPFLVDPSYSEQPAKLLKLNELLGTQVKSSKAIVWTSFIKNAAWLGEQLPQMHPAVVHGEIGIDRRNAAIDRFKHDDNCQLLVATPGVAKEGLTLTVANHAIFYDRSFSLDDYLQAQDRIHRISQQQDCFVHNLIAENTIDEWVDRLLYVKFLAAQIAQGDISQDAGSGLFEINLSEMLAEVLGSKITDNKGTCYD